MTPRRGECKSTSGRVPLLSRFQIEDIGITFQRFPSQAKKNTEIPFSNRRYWHYFPEKPKKTRKSCPFSNEVPITSPEKTRKFRFQIEDIDIIFQRLPSQAKKIQRKSRFQIEDIGIIFQRFPSQAQKKHGNSVFK